MLCLGSFLFFNSYGSINVALPTIQREFGSSLTAVQWISTVGLVMTSSLSLCLGRAGDLLGRSRLYKLGVLLYALGSGFGAAAQNLPQLVAARVVMTLGLAMAIPMAPAILALASSHDKRGWMLGLLLGATALGRASGPLLGGILLHLWGWRGVFLLTCFIGMVASVAVLRTFRRHERTRGETFDVGGAVSLIVAYPSLLVGLSMGARSDWNPAVTFGWFGLAAAGLAVFIVMQFRARHPLIPLILLRSAPLMAGLFSLVLCSAAYFPLLVLTPLYLQNVLEMSPLEVGLVVTVLPVFAALLSPLSGRLADRGLARRMALMGLASTALGILLYARLDADSSRWMIVLPLALVGMGIGLFLPANQRLNFAVTPHNHYGILGGLLTAAGPGSGALGVLVAVSLVETGGWHGAHGDPLLFVRAQQFTFLCLFPVALLAVALAAVQGREWRVEG